MKSEKETIMSMKKYSKNKLSEEEKLLTTNLYEKG
jgi:hypothetical protein